MKITEYEDIDALEHLFDLGWVKYTRTTIGSGESGINVSMIKDEKSEVIYLERYNPTAESMTVYSYNKSEYPLEWIIEEGGRIKGQIINL
jgi:hypothetical protein